MGNVDAPISPVCDRYSRSINVVKIVYRLRFQCVTATDRVVIFTISPVLLLTSPAPPDGTCTQRIRNFDGNVEVVGVDGGDHTIARLVAN